MQVYLLRTPQSDTAHATEPSFASLTELGVQQAAALGRICHAADIQHLCLSTVRRAQQAADIIEEAVPQALRWDLDELEDVTVDDLMGDPSATRLVAHWTADQYRLGLRQLWARVIPAWARIEIHAAARGIERLAILGHERVLQLLLLNWLGLDWRALALVQLALEPGGHSRVTLAPVQPVSIDWLNRLP